MSDNPTPLEQIARILDALSAEARRQDKEPISYVIRFKAFKLAAREKIASLVLQLLT